MSNPKPEDTGAPCCPEPAACCCGPDSKDPPIERPDAPWLDGQVFLPFGPVPRLRTRLSAQDHFGAIKARWGVGRFNYIVPPGIYAVGQPGADSAVLVSANYKLSLDHLRAELDGLDAWVLVLDTRGINVWCAAGKGTFGTEEIVRRIEGTGLHRVVSHRDLVVPQLGAPGVSAHEVKARTGFRVIYGPVRATDLRAFLSAGFKATPAMRRVRFGLWDRTVLVPVELMMGAGKALLISVAFLALGGLSSQGYTLSQFLSTGLQSFGLFLGSFVAATTLGPMLLPWLPGRAFATKGAFLGLILALSLLLLPTRPLLGSWPQAIGWVLLIPSVSSFVLMNFTGASTYTSLSGVLREMKLAVPIQSAVAIIGLALWIAGLFFGREISS